MPIIEELDEDGNVLEEDGADGEKVPEMDEETRRQLKEKVDAMEAAEKERVAKQFALGEDARLQGNERLQKADYEGACESYQQALQELTLVGNEAENRAKAEKANLALHLNLALAKLKLRKYEDVKYHTGSALLVEPKNVKALYRRGVAQASLAREASLFQEAEAEAAAKDFEAVLEVEPSNVEAQKELQRIRAELRAHERDLLRKQKETWGQVFGGKTITDEEEVPDTPLPTVRSCRNADKHLIVSCEGASVEEPKGHQVLCPIDLELREQWCVGFCSTDAAPRRALANLFANKATPAHGRIVVHEKTPKPGRKQDVEPIDRSLLVGVGALVMALLVGTEMADVFAVQRWAMRVIAVLIYLILYMAWKFGVKEPLTVHTAFASGDPAVLGALPAGSTVEELLAGQLARQVKNDERRERVISMLAAAGFQGTGDAKGTPAKYIEQGVKFGDLPVEQQRVVQVLQCIACRPEVLVCSDALEGLPLENQARLLRMLKRMKQECKVSILFLSPDLEQVDYLADTIGLLAPGTGELLEKGPTQEVLETPRHPEMQAYMASYLEQAGRKSVGGPVQARCKDLIGNAALDGPWIPPKYT